ncbi:hypothetical protein G8764_11085 [Pseudomaricurvus alcaniphilus]|nr:hypothetical protein [Pseudomaricurvus alcaniphilus]
METTPTMQPPLPTLGQLGKSMALALSGAAVLLVTAVLPAEYGIDPLGTGKLMGLTQLGTEAAAESVELVPAATPANATSAAPVVALSNAFQSEQRSIVLEPFDGIEMKALMTSGDHIVFNWSSDSPVYSDMHGERHNAGDEFTSYWKEKQQSQATGAFTAPFDGTHGWYWQNMGEEPITVKLVVSGTFAKLYTP